MSAKLPRILVEGSNFDQDELNRLLARFMKIDADSNGTIEKDEFLAIPTVQNNPLAGRLVEVFDTDGNGEVDFGEFVHALSTFSSKGNLEEKLRFTFNVFDIDGDGKQQIVDKTIIEADTSGTGALSFADFKRAIDSSAIADTLTLDSF